MAAGPPRTGTELVCCCCCCRKQVRRWCALGLFLVRPKTGQDRTGRAYGLVMSWSTTTIAHPPPQATPPSSINSKTVHCSRPKRTAYSWSGDGAASLDTGAEPSHRTKLGRITQRSGPERSSWEVLDATDRDRWCALPPHQQAREVSCSGECHNERTLRIQVLSRHQGTTLIPLLCSARRFQVVFLLPLQVVRHRHHRQGRSQVVVISRHVSSRRMLR
jgi:hypothetical protein